MKRLFGMRNKKGFTLVEIIVSIAALALASGFILQLFLLSSEMNRKAEAGNEALMISKSIISVFKSTEDPDELIEGGLFGAGDPEYLDNGCFRFTSNYDQDWNKTGKASDGYKLEVLLQLDEDRSADMNKLQYKDGKSGDIVHQYWSLDIGVDMVKENKQPEKLLENHNEKYFVYLKTQ